MGIREEIERMRVPEYWVAAKERNQKVDEALTILDEHLGELVDEIPAEEFAFYRTIPEGAGPDKFLKWIDELLVANPGDHISIYRRKKNGNKR